MLVEYECRKCNKIIEKLEHISERDLPFCLHCGEQMERVISKPAPPVFAGKHWSA